MEAKDIQNIQLKPKITIKGSRSFRYLETYVFKIPENAAKNVKKNRANQSFKTALNILFWSKCISVNTKKRIFCTMTESMLS
jgi:hypothetical protein